MVQRKDLQAAFKACCTFSDFQVYRFGGVSPVEMDVLTELLTKDSAVDNHAELNEANTFFNAIKKKEAAPERIKEQIKRLQASLIKGKLNDFKSCLRSIPKEALFLIDGLEFLPPGLTLNPFPGHTDDITVETTRMTVLEVACTIEKNR